MLFCLQWLTHCLKMKSLSSSTTPQLLLWLALECHTYSRTYQTSARNRVWLRTTVKTQDPMQLKGFSLQKFLKCPQFCLINAHRWSDIQVQDTQYLGLPTHIHIRTYIHTYTARCKPITEAAPNQSGVHYLGVVRLSSRERL